jgi:hypothetical protein
VLYARLIDPILGRTRLPLLDLTHGWAAAISRQLLPSFLSCTIRLASTRSTTGWPMALPLALAFSTSPWKGYQVKSTIS